MHGFHKQPTFIAHLGGSDEIKEIAQVRKIESNSSVAIFLTSFGIVIEKFSLSETEEFPFPKKHS